MLGLVDATRLGLVECPLWRHILRTVDARTSKCGHATWLKRSSLQHCVMSLMSFKPLVDLTQSFVMKSVHWMARMRHWHCTWKDCRWAHLMSVKVQVSEPYKSTNTTQAMYRRSFFFKLRSCCRQTSVRSFTAPRRSFRSNLEVNYHFL